MSNFIFKTNGSIPSNHKIFGTTKADIITVDPAVTFTDIVIDGKGGGDTISGYGKGQEVVMFNVTDHAYMGGNGTDILAVGTSNHNIYLQGSAHHAGYTPSVKGFDELDLTNGGSPTAGRDILHIDALGVDNFTGKRNPISHTLDTMIVLGAETDSYIIGPVIGVNGATHGWTLHTTGTQPYVSFLGATFQEYTQIIDVKGVKELVTLYIRPDATDVVTGHNMVAPLSIVEGSAFSFNIDTSTLFTHTDNTDSLANHKFAYTLLSPLPNGLSLNSATGVISGVPIDSAGHEIVGSFPITVKATNTDPANQFDPHYSATASFTINVTDAHNEVSANVAPSPLAAQEGASVSNLFSASTLFTSDDSLTYMADPSHPLPNGLTIDSNTGIISGTPTDSGGEVVGPYTVDIIATNTDSNNPGETIASNSFVINVSDATDTIVAGNPIPLTPVNLGTEGTAISNYDVSQFFAHSNPAENDDAITYAVTSGSLPAGVTLQSNGMLTGTPTDDILSYTVGITATSQDANNGNPSLAQTFTFSVNDAVDSIVAGNPIPVTPINLGTEGTTIAPYDVSQFFAHSNPAENDDAITYAVTSGSLPAGVTLQSNGMLTGTPTDDILSYTVGITATSQDANNGNPSLAQTFTFSVNDAVDSIVAGNPIPVTPINLGTEGTTIAPYDVSQYFAHSNPVENDDAITYAVTSGSLPAGVTLQSNGTLMGTPTDDILSYTVGITATSQDANNGNPSLQQTFTFSVNDAAPVYTNPLVSSPANTFLTTSNSSVPTVATEALAVAAAFVNPSNQVNAGNSGDNLAVGNFSFLNYNLFLTSGFINVNDVNIAGGNDGNDLIPADTSSATPGPSFPTITFGGTTYNLFNGDEKPVANETTNLNASGKNLFVGGDNSAGINYTITANATATTDTNILIGGTNSGAGNYTLTINGNGIGILVGGNNSNLFKLDASGSSGNNVLVEGTNSGNYSLQGGTGNDIFFAGNSTGTTTYTGGGGVDTLSFIAVTAGISIDLGNIGNPQTTGGDGGVVLNSNFSILQGSNFDDTLMDTQSLTGTSGGLVGGPIAVTISSESINGMGGNDTIKIDGTATGGSGNTGNEATTFNQTNAQVTFTSDTLDAGTGTGGQLISLIGTATGGSATVSFGNHAAAGFTAISAQVDITGSTLASESTATSDTFLIQALSTGGNEGPAAWNPMINTDANYSEGTGSIAISAQSIVDGNTVTGGAAGVTGGGINSSMIDAQAHGGDATTHSTNGLYANQAINGAEAISAQVTVGDPNNSLLGNHLDGHGTVNSDNLLITAIAVGGNGTSPGFSANVSGFDPDGNTAHYVAGGTAISAQTIVANNALTEHSTDNATLGIDATATGGNGQFWGNLAITQGAASSLAISADVLVDNNSLTSGTTGNDILDISATAQGGLGKNGAYVNSTAIDTRLDVSHNTLTAGGGEDNLGITITSTPGGVNAVGTGGAGTLHQAQITVVDNMLNGGTGNDTLSLLINYTSDPSNSVTITGNDLVGGSGNNILIFNDPTDILNPTNNNVLNGGVGGFNTLIEQVIGANLDLTAAGVAGGTVQNIEKVDLTASGTNSLTVNESAVLNLNPTHALYVTGVAGDSVHATAGGFVDQGSTVTGDGLGSDAAIIFEHYHSAGGADLYVQQVLTVI